MQNSGLIYKTTRMAAGYTQERLAELCDTSPRSIQAFESGERIPSDEMVVRMADVCNCQFLAYQHLRNNMELARSILPEVCPANLPVAVLKLQKEVNDFLVIRDEMIEITCDGIIDESEQNRWNCILKEINDVCQAVIALNFVHGGSTHD